MPFDWLSIIGHLVSGWGLLILLFSAADSIKALEYRQGDKQAKDFLRKIKQRMGSS